MAARGRAFNARDDVDFVAYSPSSRSPSPPPLSSAPKAAHRHPRYAPPPPPPAAAAAQSSPSSAAIVFVESTPSQQPKGLPRVKCSLLDEIAAQIHSGAHQRLEEAEAHHQLHVSCSVAVVPPPRPPPPRPAVSPPPLLSSPTSSIIDDTASVDLVRMHYAESEVPHLGVVAASTSTAAPPPPPPAFAHLHQAAAAATRRSSRHHRPPLLDPHDNPDDEAEYSVDETTRSPRFPTAAVDRRSRRASHGAANIEMPSLQRHQSHYFSNVDLFQQNGKLIVKKSTSFCLHSLHYAKASEFRSTPYASPHLRVIDLCFDLDSRSQFDRLALRAVEHHRLLHHVTLELFGGDTVALLYTAESEMQTLIRVLAGVNVPPGQISGTLEINGHKLKPRAFGERVAHVAAASLPAGLTLIEHLHLYSRLVAPATSAFKRDETIEQLIQGLALTPFRDQLIENLGDNEAGRAKMATKMLLDTDLLLCENIFRDMDLYDAAFLIDFVRDWAQRLKRIFVIAMTPATLEILTMFAKCAILTCGRLVYVGRSVNMVAYFESIGYVCPSFKSPCDYYVDLVTHDVLSVESARESMTRIRTLAEIWMHKRRPLHTPRGNIVSPKVQHAATFAKIFYLYRLFWCRAINRPLSICWELLVSILMSLTLSWLFMSLPLDRRSGINDRFGFVCTILLVAQLPLALIGTRTIILDWPLVEHDTAARIYTRRTYLVAKLCFDAPLASLAAVGYAVPAFLLTGQNPHVDSALSTLIAFVVVVVCGALLARYTAWCFALFAQSVLTGALNYCLMFFAVLLFSGFLVFPNDQLLGALQSYNPVKLLAAELVSASFLGVSRTGEFVEWALDAPRPPLNKTELLVDCQKRRILATRLKQIPIYTVAQCLKTRGADALRFSAFTDATRLDTRPTATSSPSGGLLLAAASLMLVVSLLAVVHQRHVAHRPLAIRALN